MPKGIIAETCPAPNCNLTTQDVESCVEEMTDYIELFKEAFVRPEQLTGSGIYLRGLLGDVARKNVEQNCADNG